MSVSAERNVLVLVAAVFWMVSVACEGTPTPNSDGGKGGDGSVADTVPSENRSGTGGSGGSGGTGSGGSGSGGTTTDGGGGSPDVADSGPSPGSGGGGVIGLDGGLDADAKAETAPEIVPETTPETAPDVVSMDAADGAADTTDAVGEARVIGIASLGAPCGAGAVCGAGLTCLLPTDKAIFGAGGPAHGYCTLPCTADNATVLACQTAGGSCVDFGPDANTPQVFCMLNCVQGVAGANRKCQLRTDVACTRLAAPAGGAPQDVCIPVCSQDSDCPGPRRCDEALSVCVDTPRAGDHLGAHCDPQAATGTCAGGCLPLGNGVTVLASICSRRCVFGALNECNWVDKPMSLAANGPHGVCALVSADADIGDEGFCTQECDVPADCSDQTDPGTKCDTSVPAIGHGFCSWGP